MKIIIIAEAGVNHNGRIDLAKKMIDTAADAGADYVKFQTFKSEKLVDVSARKADYQIANTNDDDNSQFNMLKQLELDVDAHNELIAYCLTKNIGFLSTAFDLESVDLLLALGMQIFKVPSGEITNLPYLEKIGSLNKKVILSTGMSTLEEVGEALNVLVNSGTSKEKVTVLHCNTEYPTPMEDVNLNAMLTIKKEFDVNIGYSDHTLGIEVSIAAVALGAKIIEKHFTLDRNMEGPDHKASLEPDELKVMVQSIRNIEKAMGTGIKQPSASERKNIAVVRKSVHLKKDLSKGHVISEDDLIMLRPGDGISPMMINDVIGRRINKNLYANHKLLLLDLD